MGIVFLAFHFQPVWAASDDPVVAWADNIAAGSGVVSGRFLVLSSLPSWDVGDTGPVDCVVRRSLESLPIHVLECPLGASTETVLRAWSEVEGVDWIEPDYIIDLMVTPDDYATDHWHLENTGQVIDGAAGTSGADIAALNAWDVTTGSSAVVIAVIDTGVYDAHLDLAGQIWTNPGEVCGNGLDDDGNGYVDDCYGWDTADGDNDADPSSLPAYDYAGDACAAYHGTFIAGLAGAVGDNGTGLPGVNWSTSIMPLKFFDDRWCIASVLTEVEAISYAVDNGAHVMNMSFGSSASSSAEDIALASAEAAGLVMVVAAGNDGADLATAPQYPACSSVGSMLVVGNSNNSDQLAVSSNYSDLWVDLAAPGTDLTSLDIDSVSDTRTGSGTSYSAPLVAGAAALVWASYPSLTAEEVLEAILLGADEVDTLHCDLTTRCVDEGRRLDLVGMLDTAAAIDAGLAVLELSDHEAVADGSLDSVGDGDGEFGAGETVALQVEIENNGWGDAMGVTGTLAIHHAALTVSRDTASFGDIAQDGAASGAQAFLVDVDSACTTDSTATATLELQDGSGSMWTMDLELDVTCTLGPDLTVSGVSVSASSVTVGDAFAATYTRENLGDRASGSFDSSVRFSLDSNITTSDDEACSASSGSIDPGDSDTVTWSGCSVPGISAGSWYVGVLIDDGDDVAETDETNNQAVALTSMKVSSAGAPSLYYVNHAVVDDCSGGSSGDGDSVPEPGETIELDLEVGNSGSADAEDVEAVISTSTGWIVLSDDDIRLGDIASGTTVSSAGSSQEFDLSIDAACDANVTATFDLELEDASGIRWTDSFELDVVCVEDADGDGFGPDSDCDDADAAVNPGVEEACNGIDDDCDGDIDEPDAADASSWYADADGDGYGDAASSENACVAPSGAVADDTDCDDGDASAHPGAIESCDGVDNDCDGDVDEDDAHDASPWYADADGDGYGDLSTQVLACVQPSGFVNEATDCNDGDPAVHPGAGEYCNNIDDDCDGGVDGADSLDAVAWYADSDGDGWGDGLQETTACDEPSGYVAVGGDCDDGDASAHPEGTEVCDDIDNDCDGVVDGASAIDAAEWFADEDGDGWGDANTSVSACEEPTGFTDNDQDCDDGEEEVNPEGVEVCNDQDDDCNGAADDEAEDALTWYPDEDGDGFGDDSGAYSACEPEVGDRSVAGDCDDTSAARHPGAAEQCDGMDDDCDGEVDEDAEDAVPWWRDADGDGHGDANHEVEACDQPDGYVGNSSDLDDTDASVHPGADRGCRCGLAGRSPSGHGARVILLALLGAFVRRREANSAPSPKPGTMTPS